MTVAKVREAMRRNDTAVRGALTAKFIRQSPAPAACPCCRVLVFCLPAPQPALPQCRLAGMRPAETAAGEPSEIDPQQCGSI